MSLCAPYPPPPASPALLSSARLPPRLPRPASLPAVLRAGRPAASPALQPALAPSPAPHSSMSTHPPTHPHPPHPPHTRQYALHCILGRRLCTITNQRTSPQAFNPTPALQRQRTQSPSASPQPRPQPHRPRGTRPGSRPASQHPLSLSFRCGLPPLACSLEYSSIDLLTYYTRFWHTHTHTHRVPAGIGPKPRSAAWDLVAVYAPASCRY